MTSITLDEIKKMVIECRDKYSFQQQKNEDEYFIEIIFDKEDKLCGVVDEEYKNKVISVDCSYGSVLIIFNAEGFLHSIEIS